MSDEPSVSATIIPFPLRQAPEPEDDGQERLRRALLALDAAVAVQREAVADWRRALADLGKVMGSLGESLQRYHGSLDTLSGRVGRLHNQALQLERTADAALAASSD